MVDLKHLVSSGFDLLSRLLPYFDFMPGIPISSLPVQPEAIRARQGATQADGSRAEFYTGARRAAGMLAKTEEWWRDHHHDIERHGYKLRPRYHPLWEPSWVDSRKDFYKSEDGQANIVRWSHFL
jgi:hypothetical protein